MAKTCRTGIADQIAALVPRLRRFAYSLCGDRDQADDLVQSACAKALGRLEQYRAGTRLDSWLFRIVQTTFIDEMRQRTRRPVPCDVETLPLACDGGRAARAAEATVLLKRLRQEIAALPVDQRSALALVAIEGLSYKEAAKVLEIPVGTVMSRLNRARKKLLQLTDRVSPMRLEASHAG